MNQTLVYHLSYIEALWTVTALVGLIFTMYNARHAWRDYRYIRAHDIFNGRRIVGKTAAWTETMRATIQVIFLSIGIGAATIPDPPPGHVHTKVVIVQAFLRWGLILASILNTWKSILLAKMRNQINAHR